MTAIEIELALTTPRRRPLERGRGAWGMGLFILTEAVLFAMLLFTYFYLAARANTWPPQLPKLGMPSLMTVLLISSSVTVHWAGKSIRSASRRGLAGGVLVTMLLGVAFLALQAMEYRERWKVLTPQSNSYGSIFYTITSVHGAHVLVGLMMLLFIEVRALSGYYDSEHHLPVRNVARYWHFVDCVWLVIFATLYVAPRFLS